MILSISVPKDRNGKILSNPSLYKPTDKEKKRIREVMGEFSLSRALMDKPWREFNDVSLLQRMNEDQKLWNNWQEPRSTDPEESWKSRAVRPIVRNRAISIAAHVTGTIMVPKVGAQDDDSAEDKFAAMGMADLMEFCNDQAQYDRTFLYSVISALVNPAAIVHTEYRKMMRTIKEIQPDGSWKEKLIEDEMNSGFFDTLVPLDELFIGNIYEHNIQRQPYLIWRRVIDYSSAQQKYGDNSRFAQYVKPGLQTVFDEASDTFYEQYDEELEGRLVEEVIYYNRLADLQLVFTNGVLLSDSEQPNPRLDKKYPFAKTGYSLFDEGKFFYHPSLVFNMSRDAEIVNKLYRIFIDSSVFQANPPVATFGPEDITSAVTVPGSMHHFNSPEARIEKLDLGQSLQAGLAALEKVESSVSESSADLLQSGQAEKGSQTAFEISRLESNARIMLGLFGKMIGFLVRDWGELRVGDILQYLTVGEAVEISGEDIKMKFKSFLVPERTTEGKQRSRRLMFDESINQMTEEDVKMEEMRLAEEAYDADTELWKINPSVFRTRKFKVVVTPDVVAPPSDNLKKVVNLELYDRAIANPLADQDKVTREFLFGSYDQSKGRVDDFMAKQQPGMMLPQGQEVPSVLNKVFGQQAALQV